MKATLLIEILSQLVAQYGVDCLVLISNDAEGTMVCPAGFHVKNHAFKDGGGMGIIINSV